MFDLFICWWTGGKTLIYNIATENEVVNTIYEVPFGHARKFIVFKGNEVVAVYDEFGNMI